MRRDQFAVGPVQNIEEAVLVGLDHDSAKLAANLDIGEQMLVGGVHVVHIVGCVLKIAGNFARLRADGENAIGEQAIQALARSGIVWLGVAGTPVD